MRALSLAAVSLLALAGCQKSSQNASAPDPRPDNALVNYTDGLKNDVDRAKAAQEQANRAIKQETEAANQAAEQPAQ